MDLETRIKVNLLQWIRRVLKKPLSNAASTLRYVIGTDSLQAYFAPKRGANLKWTTGIKFYTSLMKIWDEYHGYKPLNDSEVRWEPLWQNKRILNGGRPLQGGTWSRAGIQHIADICYPNTGRFLSHTEISNRYNIGCSFLGILKIRMSIPLHWRRMLTDQPNHPLHTQTTKSRFINRISWTLPPLEPRLFTPSSLRARIQYPQHTSDGRKIEKKRQ